LGDVTIARPQEAPAAMARLRAQQAGLYRPRFMRESIARWEGELKAEKLKTEKAEVSPSLE
jgi:hypothetical protein